MSEQDDDSRIFDSAEMVRSREEFVALMTPDPKPTALLPCPWCTTPPEVCKAAGYGFTVECVNELCTVAPALGVTRGRANAVKAWNTRAQSPAQADYEQGLQDGGALAVATIQDNRGHLNYLFDGKDCCRFCALVRPAGGWTRWCKGPHELTLRDTESPAQAEWLPIESAPFTGEPVLIAHGNSVWEDEWDAIEGCWQQCGRGGSHQGEVPSHWQHLPQPPKEQQ